ncbi:ArsR/SmtB family transcription factor [Mucilaginibacter sp. AW1-3]
MHEQFAYIASLLGEPVRAKMLWTLLDGKAYTATELSLFANASPQTTSTHLSKLLQADILRVESQGRHRYYRFARHEVAYAIEAMTLLIKPDQIPPPFNESTYPPVKFCRSCYDHLAGKVSVDIAASFLQKGFLTGIENNYQVSDTGTQFFTGLGIDVVGLRSKKRVLAKPCLDWSERKPHVAGSLGSALLTLFLQDGWVRRTANSRVILFTPKGKLNLYEKLGLTI